MARAEVSDALLINIIGAMYLDFGELSSSCRAAMGKSQDFCQIARTLRAVLAADITIFSSIKICSN
jgi:hypothetical protein